MTVYYINYVSIGMGVEGGLELVRPTPIRSFDDIADITRMISERVGGKVLIRHWQELPEMSAQAQATEQAKQS